MNTVLVMVMLILVIYALKEGQIWVALGIGLVMAVLLTGEEDKTKVPKKFMYGTPDLGAPQDMKEQMLRVKYQPKWDGNNWWEEVADHWGSSVGRTIGLIR